MNFDIKDVKSWATRNEIELGKFGFFADSIEQLYKDECVSSKLLFITKIDAFCFGDESDTRYAFFLPLDAVKKDKPKEKKYRPIKNMREFTEIILGKKMSYIIDVGEKLLLRRKCDKLRFNALITKIEFNNNFEIAFVNDITPQVLLENFEVMTIKGKFEPFGVEVKEDE